MFNIVSGSQQQFLLTILAWIAWHLAKPYIASYLPQELVNIVDVAIPGAGAIALHQMFSKLQVGQKETNQQLADTKMAATEAKAQVSEVAQKVELVQAVTAKMDPKTTAKVEAAQVANGNGNLV